MKLRWVANAMCLQLLNVVCYMLYQTDLVINFNINATKCKPKKYFSHKGGGANMYQFHQMRTQICMTLTRCNLIVRSLVTSLKKGWLFIFFNYGYFLYSFYPII